MPVPGTNNTFLGLLGINYDGPDPAAQKAFRDVRENFQRLMGFLWPKDGGDGPPSGLTTCTVVTGFSGAHLTTATIKCLGFTAAANITLGTETVITGASIGSPSLIFARKDIVVFSAAGITATTLSGTNCATP